MAAGVSRRRVLLVEDNEQLAGMVRDYLGRSEFDVTVAGTGSEGLALQGARTFDAIILDIMLPDISGLEVCRSLRPSDDTPILMLTAKGDPNDRIVGLELGADDYLPKPFEPRELLARLRAILRRGRASGPDDTLRFGRLEVDRAAMKVSVDGAPCDLTSHQFRLLEALACAPGRVLSREQLVAAAQGTEMVGMDRSVDVHISRIRAEIEDDPRHPKRVLTIRGAGYVFARSQD
ncbi:MAG: response regulator transcription factor [Myxococcota bacterium]